MISNYLKPLEELGANTLKLDKDKWRWHYQNYKPSNVQVTL